MSSRPSCRRSLALVIAAVIGLMAWVGAGSGGPAAAAADKPVAAAAAAPPSAIDRLLATFPEGLAPEQIDAVVGVMGDAELRAALTEELRRRMEAARAAASSAISEETPIHYYGEQLRAVAGAYPDLPAALARPFAGSAPAPDAMAPGTGATRVGPVRLVLHVAAALLAGWAAMIAVQRFLTRRREAAQPAPADRATAAGWIGRTVIRLARDTVEIAAFLAGMLLYYTAIHPTATAAPLILHQLMMGVLVLLAGRSLLGLLFAPKEPGLRLLPLPDGPSAVLHHLLVTLVGLVALVRTVLGILASLGLDRPHLLAVGLPLSILPFGFLLWMVWRHRPGVDVALAARLRDVPEAARLITGWPVAATLYLLGLWVVTIGGALRGVPDIALKVLLSFLLVVLLPVLGWLAHEPLRRAYGLGSGAAEEPEPAVAVEAPPQPAAVLHDEALPVLAPASAEPGVDRRAVAEHHVRRLMRAVWVVLAVAILLLTSLVWGYDPRAYDVGAVLFRLLGNIGAVLLLGYVGWALIQRWVDVKLEESRTGVAGDETRSQRLRTLLPLFRKFMQVVLFSMVAMIVLSSLGVNIGPLIAGAGVVGIAIGFGAQSTIANILTGVSFLMTDAFRLGDYIEMGTIRGNVEGISLTTLRLRHQRGAVHTVPFSQIRSLTNYSRDWMLMRLLFRIPPETDLELVRKLVKEVGKDLLKHPELGGFFIDALKSQGVRGVEDNAAILGVKYIAKPGGAFLIRKEAYKRLLKAFQDNGIELVGRGVVVKVEGADHMPPQVVGAAAEAAAETAA